MGPVFMQGSGGYLVMPENGNTGVPAVPVRSTAGAGGPGRYNSILNMSIDMLLGSTNPLGRAESRLNWSDDGTAPSSATAAAPGLVAGAPRYPAYPTSSTTTWQRGFFPRQAVVLRW